MADEKKQNILNQLFSMFSFKTEPGKQGRQVLKPTKRDFDGKQDSKVKLTDEYFNPYVRQLWNLWKQDQSAFTQFEDLKKLFAEMDNMFNTNTIMYRVLDMLPNEIVQADNNNRVIGVEAKKDQKAHIEAFFDKINIEALIFPTAQALVKYGNVYWVNSFYEEGISEVLIADPYDIEDRIEFTPHEVEKQLRAAGGISSMFRNMTNDHKLKILADNIMSKEDYTSFFRSYLFGFQIGSFVLPPWRCLHFRNYEANSFFSPYGTPAYLHALAPSKLYDMALGLQTIARQANFPIDVFRIKFPGGASPTDKMEYIVEFIRDWQNSGLRQVRKEQQGIGEQIVIPEDLMTYEQIKPEIDLGRIDDLELLRDDIILATGLPRNFLDPNNGGFGNSGVSLVQQFKPFARTVYKYQSIILEQISQLVKIDMIQSGKFTIDEIDFKLSMPFPESQVNNELISSQRDLFSFANDVLDGIKSKIGEEIPLPVDLIKDVYKKVTSFDPTSIDTWVDQFVAEREKFETQSAQSSEMPTEGGEEVEDKREFTFESVRKKTGAKLIREMIDNEITSKFNSRVTEHCLNGRHYYSSRKQNQDFDLSIFEQGKVSEGKERLKLMNEEFKLKKSEIKKLSKFTSKKRAEYTEFLKEKGRPKKNMYNEILETDDEKIELEIDDLLNDKE